jgi:hypothetical protein
VLSTVETKSFSGNIWPQLKAIFRTDHVPIERIHDELVGRQELCGGDQEDRPQERSFWPACGRKRAWRWRPFRRSSTDTKSIVVEDCCGDVTQLAHDNAMQRVIQAGAKPVTGALRQCWSGSATGLNQTPTTR